MMQQDHGTAPRILGSGSRILASFFPSPSRRGDIELHPLARRSLLGTLPSAQGLPAVRRPLGVRWNTWRHFLQTSRAFILSRGTRPPAPQRGHDISIMDRTPSESIREMRAPTQPVDLPVGAHECRVSPMFRSSGDANRRCPEWTLPELIRLTLASIPTQQVRPEGARDLPMPSFTPVEDRIVPDRRRFTIPCNSTKPVDFYANHVRTGTSWPRPTSFADAGMSCHQEAEVCCQSRPPAWRKRNQWFG